MKKTGIVLLAVALLAACLLLCSCSDRYTASEGGKVERLGFSEIRAVSENGYRFVGWSDGESASTREYERRNGNETLSALFEPIRVELRDGEVKKEITLSELEESDLSSLMPSDFGKVYFSGYFSDEAAELFSLDPKSEMLSQIKALFLRDGISDTEDIILHASYIFYESTEGGRVELKDDGVVAISEGGYRFLGWSDGLLEKERLDRLDANSETFCALFEEVKVNFYIEEHMVRSIAVSALEKESAASFNGYKSGAEFLGWELVDVEDRGFYEDRIIESIYAAYEKGELNDAQDISLKASFSDAEIDGFEDFCTIAHALGGAPWKEEGRTYLNDLKVFEYNYKLGHRFFEIDLLLTRDGGVVASHDYESTVLYSDFMAMASEDFVPIDLADMVELMASYTDIYIDLDILSVYRSTYSQSAEKKLTAFYDALDAEIRESYPELYEDIYDRLVLEIFFESPLDSLSLELARTEKYGFKHFMYAGVGDKEFPMGQTLGELEALCKWCLDNGVDMMSTKIYTPEFIALTEKYEIFTFAYTFNDPTEIYDLLSAGIDCVFSDFIYM